MPQSPLDDDVADFLDDAHWSPAVTQNAVSILNRWTRWCATHTTTVRGAQRADLRGYLDDRQTARHRPGHPPQGLADHHGVLRLGRPAPPATAP